MLAYLRNSMAARRWQLKGGLICTTIVVVWLALGPSAWAQKKQQELKQEAGPPPKSYVISYIIVLAVMGVGLGAVCRPGSRSDELTREREQFDDT